MLATRDILLAFLLVLVVVLGVVVLALLQPTRIDRLVRTRRWLAATLSVSMVAVLILSVDHPNVSSVAAPSQRPTEIVPLSTVQRVVKASNKIRVAPPTLTPSLSQASSDVGLPPPSSGCFADDSQSFVPTCLFGDRSGNHTMVLYGDSHAGMWFQALDDIATRAHWKLVALTKGSCPAATLSSQAPGTKGDWVACDRWHRFAINRINRIDPDLLIISQAAYDKTPNGLYYTPAQWELALKQLLKRVTTPKRVNLILGEIPASGGPDCLAQHTDAVQACSYSPLVFLPSYDKAEGLAAAAEGATYVDVTSWFCAKSCSAIIGNYSVYYLTNHVAVGYSRFLEGVLAERLNLLRFG